MQAALKHLIAAVALAALPASAQSAKPPLPRHNKQCIEALRAVLPFVAETSIRTMKDTDAEAQILAAVRGATK